MERVPLFEPLAVRVNRGDTLIAYYGTSHRGLPHQVYKFELIARTGKNSSVLLSQNLKSRAGWRRLEKKLPAKLIGKVNFEFHVFQFNPTSMKFEKIGDELAGWGGLRIGNFKRQPDERNLVIVSLDTCRVKSLSKNGNVRLTSPHLDRIAKSSVDFLQASSPSSWTLPAHMSLFTGRYPSFHTMTYNFDTHFHELPLEIPLLTNVLRERGYVGVAFTGGAKLSSAFGYYRGFDWYQENTNIKTDAVVNFSNAIDWVKKNRNKKFYLFLHTYEIHTPYTHKFFSKKGVSSGEESQALYEGDIKFTDQWLGKFMKTMDDLGLSEKTIFIITSDHGEEFEERGLGHYYQHGHTLKDELIKIPFLLYAPGLVESQKIENHQLSLVDALPTAFDLLDVHIDPHVKQDLDGKSVSGFIQSGAWPEESFAFSEVTTLEPARYSVRYSTGKAIYKFTVNPEVVFPEYGPIIKRNIFGHLMPRPDIIQFAAEEETKNYFDLVANPDEKMSLEKNGDLPKKKLNDLMRSYFERFRDLRNLITNANLSDEEGKKHLKTLGY